MPTYGLNLDDGNGRVGRAIAEQALAQDLNRPHLLSLSSIIEKDRKNYYAGISQASRGDLNITQWVNWFTDAVLNAQNEAIKTIDFVLKKSSFWDTHQNSELNQRQIKVLKRIFKAGIDGFESGISAKKYTAITGCSKATATRDLTDLLNKGCTNKLEGAGRNIRYGLKFKDESLLFNFE